MENRFEIVLMTEDYASQIMTWQYTKPYDVYNITSEEGKSELLDGTYYAALESGELFGFFCYGKNAQVANDAGAYEDLFLTDIGLGMKPELCGKNYGYDFVSAGLDYGLEKLGIKGYRLSVLDFNIRAIKLYEKLGFKATVSFTSSIDTKYTFKVMIRDDLFTYQTDRIEFRPLTMDLVDRIHHYASNEHVNRYIGWPLTKTKLETEEYLKTMMNRHHSGAFRYVSVIDKATQNHVAVGMLFAFDYDANHTELGYVIDLDYWGKGYGTEIAKMLKAYAFNTLKMNKMFARVVNVNKASSQVLIKNGFELEAVLKDYYKIEGKLRNCEYYTVYNK